MPQKTHRRLVERLRILHLMKQFANPTIRHRRHNDTRLLAGSSDGNRRGKLPLAGMTMDKPYSPPYFPNNTTSVATRP
jgi:hypothetical protein